MMGTNLCRQKDSDKGSHGSSPQKVTIWSFKYKQAAVKNFIKGWELAKENAPVTNEIQWNGTVFPHFSGSEARRRERKEQDSKVLQIAPQNFYGLQEAAGNWSLQDQCISKWLRALF